MTHSTPLTKDRIADTSMWRLILRISPREVSALMVGPESVECSVIFHSEELPDSSPKSLENAIYDNPLLLSDFSAIDVIFSTPELMLTPCVSEELSGQMAEAMLPDYAEPRRVGVDKFPGGELVYVVPADIFNFVTRTFAAARIHHALAINATYLSHRNTESSLSAKTYVLCEGPGEMSIVDFNAHGSIAYLNCPRPLSPADCAYYSLAGPSGSGSIIVGGEPSLRNEVCDILRKIRPDSRVLPLTLDEDLLYLRRLAPEAQFDMLFLTKL